jgi:tetratricopeptide (TPR) repeat protein
MLPVEEALQSAVKIHRDGDVAAAERLYRELLIQVPTYTAAWEHLGHAQLDQGRLNDALASYQHVLELDPNHASALNNLGVVHGRLGQLQESLACYDRALAIQPGFNAAHKNKALALVTSGRVEAALAQFEEALRHNPGDADLHKSVGLARLMLGDFADGWPEHEWRYEAGDPPLPRINRPLWDGSTLYGKTILLVSEPGLGDDIHFIRYAAWLKARYNCRTLFLCRPRLRALLSTCKGIDGWVEDVPPDRLPPCDVFAPLMRLPAVLAHTPRDFPADIPYLTADATLTDWWKRQLANDHGRKIGIHWQAGHPHRLGSMRSIPLAEFARLTRAEGVQLFSLQKGPGADEVSTLAGVVDLGRQLDETTGAFVETAAVLKNLDLLITCDTAIAHLAGALGVPVWVALCNMPDWRWGMSGESTVWYPTMRLFRQTAGGDWTDVMERIAETLRSS